MKRFILLFLFIMLCFRFADAADYSYSVIYLGQDNHEESDSISRSTNLAACVAMLLQYFYPNSDVDVLDVYRSGIQSYQYDGPAIGYKNVGFNPFDLGFEVLSDEFKDEMGRGKYYSNRGEGQWSSDIASLDEVEQYLELWWGECTIDSPAFSSIVEEIKVRPVIIKVKYNLETETYLLLKGYDDKSTSDTSDDVFYAYDPFRGWKIIKGDSWEVQSDGKALFDYATLSGWYSAASNNKRISFYPDLNKSERRHSFVLDNHSVELDNIAAKSGDNYLWKEYYGSGNWFYPIEAGHWAKWSPNISKSGYYNLSVVFKGDNNPYTGDITLAISAADHYSSNAMSVSINYNSSSGFQKVSIPGRYFFEKEHADISYIKINNVPANCRIDAVRFEYVDAITEGLKYLTDNQDPSNGNWAYSSYNVGATSLAALSFLNADYSESSETVSKAINFIKNNINEKTFYGNYETALAMLALTATKNPDHNAALLSAKNYLHNIQNSDGGWGYKEAYRSDLSNSQFSIMALNFTGATGHEDKFYSYLSQSQDYTPVNACSKGESGGFYYQPCNGLSSFNRNLGMTGAGLWGLRLIHVDIEDIRVQKALSWIENNLTAIYNKPSSYYSYLSYAKAMVFCSLNQEDQETWYEDWHNKLCAIISKNQATNGTWSGSYGTVVETTFALLSLQAVQPPPDDIEVKVILASPANLVIRDPLGNECSQDSCNIPGAYFIRDGDDNHRQNVSLPDLQAGSYTIILQGIDDGNCHLTVEANKGDESYYNATKEVPIKKYQVKTTNLIFSSLVGAVTIHFDMPDEKPCEDCDEQKVLRYDYTKDGSVDDSDIQRIVHKWLTAVNLGTVDDFFDINDDGQIDIFDIMRVSACYQQIDNDLCLRTIQE